MLVPEYPGILKTSGNLRHISWAREETFICINIKKQNHLHITYSVIVLDYIATTGTTLTFNTKVQHYCLLQKLLFSHGICSI